ncbi:MULTISPECIES: DMT family transporter [unclassified Limnobacter]|uniref:DMT family transporter n=1 Tax=unclassified Limnobacter TaxID=2630203 RepID=UPI00135CAE0F|nr:DMT family transporter [Limnobacter sp. 130]
MQALWMLMACLCFGTMGLMVKLAGSHVSLGEIVLFRGAVPVIGITVWAVIQGLSLKSPVAMLHLKRNIAGIIAMWCGFYATTQLPLATATTLMYTSPLFIALILWLWFGQSRNWLEQLAIAIGFGGVIAVLQPVIASDQLSTALIGLGAGAVSAIAYLQLKSLGQAKEAEWRTVLYFAGTATVTSLVYLLGFGEFTVFKTAGYEWPLLWLLALGFFGGAGNLALTRSFGSGSTWLSAALQYCTILVSTFYGITVLGDIPTNTTWIGVLLIITCGGISSYATHRRKLNNY